MARLVCSQVYIIYISCMYKCNIRLLCEKHRSGRGSPRSLTCFSRVLCHQSHVLQPGGARLGGRPRQEAARARPARPAAARRRRAVSAAPVPPTRAGSCVGAITAQTSTHHTRSSYRGFCVYQYPQKLGVDCQLGHPK